MDDLDVMWWVPFAISIPSGQMLQWKDAQHWREKTSANIRNVKTLEKENMFDSTWSSFIASFSNSRHNFVLASLRLHHHHPELFQWELNPSPEGGSLRRWTQPLQGNSHPYPSKTWNPPEKTIDSDVFWGGDMDGYGLVPRRVDIFS